MLLAALPLLTVAAALAQDTVAVTACRGETTTLEAPAGFETYSWTPSEGLPDPLARAIDVVVRGDRAFTVEYERAAGDNLVVNGDFEAGNTGFSTEYRYEPAGSFDQGTYAILTDPRDFNSNFRSCTDPRGARSRLYVADGATRRGAKAWCQRVRVEPGRRYAFALSVASLVSASPPRLSFSIADRRVGTANLPRSTCAWQRFFTIWRAPADAATVEICVVNDNETPDGNDFALDDISLRPLEGDGPGATTFQITVAEAQFARLDTALCAGTRYTANGLDLAPGEAGVADLRTTAGCDSTLTVVTTVAEPIVTTERNDTNCLGQTVAYEGLALTRDTVIVRRSTSALGCDSTHVYTLRFFSRTALETTVTPPRCPGDDDGRVDLRITAGKPPFTIRWADGSGDTVLRGVGAGDYGVVVTDRDGCRAETTVTAADPPPITIADLAPAAAACFGEASGSVAYVATGGTGQLRAVAVAEGRRLDPQRLPQGDYVLRVTDTLGCFAERPFSIASPPEITLALQGDSSVILGETARYVLGVGGEDVRTIWTYGATPVDSLVVANGLSFVPLADGRVRVVGTDANGCTREAGIDLRVRRVRQNYFPSAFTPDGDDLHEEFRAVEAGALARVVRLEVYHRWGGLAFAGAGPGASWDGRDRESGRALDPGVFVYRAVVELIDGTLGEEVGEVVLLR